MAQRWSVSEDLTLKRLYPSTKKSVLVKELDKPWISIRRRAIKLGIKRDRELRFLDKVAPKKRKDSWTEEDFKRLKEIFINSTKEFLVNRFPKRSWQSIRREATKLGLKRNPEIIKKEMIEGGKSAPPRDNFWSNPEYELLKKNYCGNSKEYLIALFPKRSWQSIRREATKLGLKRDPEIVKRDNIIGTKKALKEKYGVDSFFKIPEVLDRIKEGNLKKYGVEFPMQSKIIREKSNKAVLGKYGVGNVFQLDGVKEKIKATNLDRYGTESPIQSQKIKDKIKDTCIERYGVKNPFQLTDRVKEGHFKKYGVEHPQKSQKIREKTKATNIERYGVEYPSQNKEVKKKLKQTLNTLEVKEKKAQALKNKESGVSSEEKVFFNFLKKEIDSEALFHEIHSEYKWVMDSYLPKYGLWVQYDGVYWHGRYALDDLSSCREGVRRVIEADRIQNKCIPNMVRFWSDDIQRWQREGCLIEKVKEKINKCIKEVPIISHQHIKKQQHYSNDLKSLPFNPDDVKAKDFILEKTIVSKEITDFIKKYEWLGTVGSQTKWCFKATYKDHLGGVIIINEPNAYSMLLGKNTKIYEALIQRGSTVSWAPRNLGSRLLMFSCRWMIENTDKRLFVGYSDPRASEVGFIYQACGFEFLGGGFGVKELYRHPGIKKEAFNNQYLSRTSTLKSWCRENNVSFKKEWLKENGFKDLSRIPEEIKTAWDFWKTKIKSESVIIKQPPKYKYALLLGVNKREKERLSKLKTYLGKDYPKENSTKIEILNQDIKKNPTVSRVTPAKIEYIIRNQTELSRVEIARDLNESERWVKRQISALIKEGRIKSKR